jgi:hypothetical protein
LQGVNNLRAPADQLCDTCRQNVAIRRFIDFQYGRPRERRMCADCLVMHPLSPIELLELTSRIFATGKCEICGDQPFSVGGMPGETGVTRRAVLCRKCSDLNDQRPV